MCHYQVERIFQRKYIYTTRTPMNISIDHGAWLFSRTAYHHQWDFHLTSKNDAPLNVTNCVQRKQPPTTTTTVDQKLMTPPHTMHAYAADPWEMLGIAFEVCMCVFLFLTLRGVTQAKVKTKVTERRRLFESLRTNRLSRRVVIYEERRAPSVYLLRHSRSVW